jgi:hypothetical protein
MGEFADRKKAVKPKVLYPLLLGRLQVNLLECPSLEGFKSLLLLINIAEIAEALSQQA